MSTPSTKCPKCGADVMTDEFGVVDYKCDSFAVKTKKTFEQSEKCTLRAALSKAVEALKWYAGHLRPEDRLSDNGDRASAVLKEISEI